MASLIEAQVDLILGGHLHQGYAAVSHVDGSPGPVVVQAGTTVSNRLRGEINGYNRIHITPGHLEIQNMLWRENRFVVGGSQRFRKTDLGWQPY